MKRIAFLLVLVAALGPPVPAQRTHYVSPDVPTDDPGGSGTIFLPWDVISYKGGLYAPVPAVSFQTGAPVDAVHKMDRPGHWLLSVEAPTEIPPGGGVFYDPDDVILFDGANYLLYFDGTAAGVPAGVGVDALFLESDDFGDLILSFDVPTTIGAMTFEPADLVAFSGGVFNMYFDASANGTTPPALYSNTTGADEAPGFGILSMDVPTDLAPSTGPPTYIPGDVPAWDFANVTYMSWVALAGWPISSEVDAYSCQANPGRVYERSVYPLPIKMNKSAIVPGNIVIFWAPSCSSGVEDYGIYQGTLGAWYSHKKINCADTPPLLEEDFTPQVADSYYLVVPYNWFDEGAYGGDHDVTRAPPRIERPRAALPVDQCVSGHVVTPCP